MGRRPKQTFLQRRHTDGQEAREKLLNITNYQRNANQNYSEISPHTSQNGHHQKIYKQQMLERVWRKGSPLALLVGMQIDTATMENSMEVPQKLKIKLPCDPAIPLLGIDPEKTIIQKDTCTPMFTAALFTIARSWKQPKCPSTDEWIKKMWYIYTMKYYSAIKRNEIESSVETWMDPDGHTE